MLGLKLTISTRIDLTRMECKGFNQRESVMDQVSIDLTRMECKERRTCEKMRGYAYRFNQNGM